MAEHKLAKNKIAQDYVIDCLALGKVGTVIMAELKEEFGISVTEANISWYRINWRARVLARRQEMEKQILDKFPYALMALRQQKLHDCLKEAEKIGRVDVGEASKLLESLSSDRYRKDAIIGMYSAMQDGIDRRLNRIQSLLKQIKDEVAPLKGSGKDDDAEKEQKSDVQRMRLAFKNASKEELSDLEKQFEKVLKKHAKSD